MKQIDKDLIDMVVRCLTEVHSYYGRTVEQAWDDVPMENWELEARKILSIIKKEYKQ